LYCLTITPNTIFDLRKLQVQSYATPPSATITKLISDWLIAADKLGIASNLV